jgi:hypothetical protein
MPSFPVCSRINFRDNVLDTEKVKFNMQATCKHVPFQFDSNHQSETSDNFIDVSGATNTVKIAPARGVFSVLNSQNSVLVCYRITITNKTFEFLSCFAQLLSRLHMNHR